MIISGWILRPSRAPSQPTQRAHDAATDNIETLKVFIVIQQNVRVTRAD